MIVLKRPACPTCDATLLGRQYYRRDESGELVRYSNERIEPDNIFEFIVCPRCDRA